jgi:hypothetical protein
MPATRTTAPSTSPTSRPVDLASPTLVSLDLHDAPLAEAARTLSASSGTRQLMAPVDDATAGAARPVTLRVRRGPYLVAMAKMCCAAGVEPTWVGESRTWLRKTDDSASAEPRLGGPSFVSGPFLVIAQGVTLTRIARATNPGPNPAPEVNLRFALLVEPKVSVVSASPSVRLTEASDETGSLLGDGRQPDLRWTSFQGPGTSEMFTASLAPGRRVGRRIVSLKGVIDLKVVAAHEVMRIDDVIKPHDGLSLGGRRVTSSPLTARGPRSWTIDLAIERRDDEDDTAWRTLADLARASRFALTDAQARPMQQEQDQWPRQEAKRLTVSAMFRRTEKLPDGTSVGAPATLEWLFPAEVKEIQVPFEFKDLPMP